jgi:hypothetical protein
LLFLKQASVDISHPDDPLNARDIGNLIKLHSVAIDVVKKKDTIILRVLDDDALLASQIPSTFHGYQVIAQRVTQTDPPTNTRLFSPARHRGIFDPILGKDLTSVICSNFSVFKLPNVIGVTGGYKVTRGFVHYDKPCIVIHVSEKLPNEALPQDGIIPLTLACNELQFPTDVISGRPVNLIRESEPDDDHKYIARSFGARQHGIYIGEIISSDNSYRYHGTLGCFCRDQNNRLGILSAGHVMKPVNANIFHHHREDIQAPHIVANVERVEYPDPPATGINPVQCADYAFAILGHDAEVNETLYCSIGTSVDWQRIDHPEIRLTSQVSHLLEGWEDTPLDDTLLEGKLDLVFKLGATTRLTAGHIENVRFYEAENVARFKIRPATDWCKFGDRGDSGSVVFDSNGCAVGLLVCAYDDGLFLAIPIKEALEALNIDIVAAD